MKQRSQLEGSQKVEEGSDQEESKMRQEASYMRPPKICKRNVYRKEDFFPEKMKIKTTEYFIVDNGNTKVMNRKRKFY